MVCSCACSRWGREHQICRRHGLHLVCIRAIRSLQFPDLGRERGRGTLLRKAGVQDEQSEKKLACQTNGTKNMQYVWVEGRMREDREMSKTTH